MEKMEKLAELKASTLQDLEIIQPKGRPEQSTSEKVFKIIVRNLLFYLFFQHSSFTTKRGKVGPKLLGMKVQRKDMMSLISLSCLFLAQFLSQ